MRRTAHALVEARRGAGRATRRTRWGYGEPEGPQGCPKSSAYARGPNEKREKPHNRRVLSGRATGRPETGRAAGKAGPGKSPAQDTRNASRPRQPLSIPAAAGRERGSSETPVGMGRGGRRAVAPRRPRRRRGEGWSARRAAGSVDRHDSPVHCTQRGPAGDGVEAPE